MMTPTSTMAAASTQAPVPTRRTVDAFTRALHALMALSFLGAYITAESEIFRLVHVTLGYTLGGLLLVRVVWGWLGPRHARLSALWGKLRGWGAWFQGLRMGQVSWRQGQNLYMALSVAVVLLAIAPVVVSGFFTDQELTGEWMQEVHEFFGNFMLAAVLAHVAGVLGLSGLRGQNLAAPMLTGRVAGAGPDLIRSNHWTLATLLLAAVLSFWVWQWQTAPQGPGAGLAAWLQLAPGKAQSDAHGGDDHGDDD